MNTNSNPLVQQILQQAKDRADSIIEDAKNRASSIMEDSILEAEKESSVEKKGFSVRLEAIEQCEVSAKRNVDRLAELKAMDNAYNEVISSVRDYFDKSAGQEDFKPVLVSWIAEGAIGLDKKEAKVAFCQKSPVDENMLRDAEKLVLEATGAEVKLTLDSQRCRSIGVVLSSLDDQVSFDNELDVRLRRYQKDIRKIVQEENARQNNR